MFAFVLLALMAIAGAAAPPEPSPVEEVRLLWAGASGGIGSGQVRFSLLDRAVKTEALPVKAARPVHGWMVRGRWAIAAEDRSLASTLELFEAEALSCEDPRPGTRLQTAEESLLLEGNQSELAPTLRARASPVAIRRCTARGIPARLVGPEVGDLPKLELERFETRLALSWTLEDGTRADSLGKPASEGTRRFATLRAARAEADVFVDAGRFVDGASSVRDGTLSLHRETAFGLLNELAPAAVTPGDTELTAGPAALLEEAPELPWTVANWRSERAELSLPPSRSITLPDGRRLAFIGIVDPELAARNDAFAEDGVSLTDPVSAAQQAIQTLRSGSQSPDAIVLLSSAGAPVLNRLRGELTGADLIVGDRDDEVSRIEAQTFELRAPTGIDGAVQGVTLPLSGLHEARLRWTGGSLSRIEVVPLPVPLTRQPDPATLARVTRVRAAAYPALEDRLLVPDDPLATIPQGAFNKAVCEATLDAADADLALLPELPAAMPIPGALTSLLVADRLALPHQVEVHHVPGDRYRTLLDRAFALQTLSCGSPLGQRFPKARGRPVEDQRLYRVVTTDRLRASTALDGLLGQARSSRKLDRSDPVLLRTEDGTARSLRSVVLQSLRELRAIHGDALLEVLLARSAADKPPRWELRLRQVSLRIEGFNGVDDEAYAQIPETRATSPSSLTIGSTADLALEYSSSKALWDARARSSFTRLRTDEDVQETADDLKLSSSVTLPLASIPLGPLSLRPFSEALLDSEITPTETEDGSQNPRQADLSLTLGFATPITGWLKAFRFGVLVLQDVAVTSKRAELGARLEGQTRVVFGPGLSWSNQLDAFYYGNTPDQDASDLQFKVYFQSRVGLPLARWLDLAVFADAFVFQGRVAQTRAVNGSFTLGAGLDLGGIFRL